jgi:hypothetical protein
MTLMNPVFSSKKRKVHNPEGLVPAPWEAVEKLEKST